LAIVPECCNEFLLFELRYTEVPLAETRANETRVVVDLLWERFSRTNGRVDLGIFE
jgi:hypothetical protein